MSVEPEYDSDPMLQRIRHFKMKSNLAGHPMLDVHEMSLGPEPVWGDCVRTRSRLGSIVETLQRLALSWFRRHGLRLVLLEIDSCR
jgi:hypothetical protein